ncbi:MAG: phosphatidate cytidylyltransferase [Ferruginibacter sp.]
MNRLSIVATLLLLTVSFSSCELVGDIFKAGFSLGIFVVVVIILLILFFVFRRKG